MALPDWERLPSGMRILRAVESPPMPPCPGRERHAWRGIDGGPDVRCDHCGLTRSPDGEFQRPTGD